MNVPESSCVVVVASEAREFSGLPATFRGARLNWPVDFARSAGNCVFVANGPGRRLAGIAVATALERVRFRALVSTGYCGALDPKLEVGDIVIADSVLQWSSGRSYTAEQLSGASGGHRNAVLSTDRVAVTSAEKEELRRSSNACAVEMEAAEIARWAAELKTPFYCVRAVSDSANDTLGMDFNAYRDDDGRFSRSRIALAAMWNPRCIPSLRRLDRNCRLAAAKLGDFLADCRF